MQKRSGLKNKEATMFTLMKMDLDITEKKKLVMKIKIY